MKETSGDIVDLGAYIPREVRDAAKRAFVARCKYEVALADKVNAMRSLSSACKKFAIRPESIEVGNLDCMSLVPASHYDSEGIK